MVNWFNHLYPYTDFHELNLDWVIATVKNGEKEIADFIGINTIKYADPILWNITSQYEANTVVVDGQTGNAYISTKAVPNGVHLNNSDYWTQIYNYADVVDTLREQIARYNEGASTTASGVRVVGDLVFLNGELYEVIAPMIAGDSYVEDSNVIKTTVWEYINTRVVAINQNITAEAEARQNADTQLQEDINNEVTARQNADTQLQEDIDNEVTARQNAIDNEVTARQDADRQLTEAINNIEFGNTKYNVVETMPVTPENDSIYEDIESDINVDSVSLKSLTEIELETINRIESDLPNSIIEITTFNISNEDGVYRNLLNGFSKIINLKKAMMTLNSDIVCLQEFIHGETFRSDLEESLLMTDNFAPNQYLLRPVIWQANATYSHEPIVTREFRQFANLTSYELRGASITRFTINNKILSVYNIHMDFTAGATQDAQFAELFTMFNNDSAEYKICCGDFNVDLSSYSGLNQFINAGYKVLNRGQYITGGGMAIDGIITSSNIDALEVNTVENNTYCQLLNSDHLPLHARLKLL